MTTGSSPEDRAAAARRVAEKIAGLYPLGHHDEASLAIHIAKVLLAFPGGDAEPVADYARGWRDAKAAAVGLLRDSANAWGSRRGDFLEIADECGDLADHLAKMPEPAAAPATTAEPAKTTKPDPAGVSKTTAGGEPAGPGSQSGDRVWKGEASTAAPVAGEAGALRRALEKILEIHTERNQTTIGTLVEMKRVARAALAPGGRPRCSKCGGSGVILGASMGDDERCACQGASKGAPKRPPTDIEYG